MALSTTSKTIWCRPDASSVSPMYMPGRLRTASRPLRTWMLSAVYVASGFAKTGLSVLSLGARCDPAEEGVWNCQNYSTNEALLRVCLALDFQELRPRFPAAVEGLGNNPSGAISTRKGT